MKYDDVMKLALERGFYFPSCEIYSDAQAGFWEYGPAGVSLKNKFLELWRRELLRRDKMIEIDGSQIMSSSVFEASGHLTSFADPIVRCTNCKSTHRADRIIAELAKVEIPAPRIPRRGINAMLSIILITAPDPQKTGDQLCLLYIYIVGI